MRIAFLFIFLVNIAGASLAQANCLPVVEEKIGQKQQKLLFVKNSQKKVLKGTFYGVGALSGAFWGTMFHLIVDGTTLPISIFAGAAHGLVFGAAAVAVVGIPMLAYNQYIKYQIRGMQEVQALLEQAYRADYEAPLLQEFHEEVFGQTGAHIATVSDWLVEGSEARAFCPEGGTIYGLEDIRNHILGRDGEREGKVDLVIELDGEELERIEAAPIM